MVAQFFSESGEFFKYLSFCYTKMSKSVGLKGIAFGRDDIHYPIKMSREFVFSRQPFRPAYITPESPFAVIGCLPHGYNRRLHGATRQALG